MSKQNCKRVFTDKTYGASLYKWSPICNPKLTKDNNSFGTRPYYCTATPSSQGQDWTTSYSYNLVVVASKQQHLAYVACDYVQ